MDQIYPDQGLITILQRIVADDFHFHLFVNNITPDRTTVLFDLTEAAWSGYVPITVLRTDFVMYGLAAHIGSAQAPPIAFNNNTGTSQSAYGYYITDVSNSVLLAVARFDSAPVIKNDGDGWVVQPIIGDVSVLSS